jgi:hypothetical protein
LFGTLNSGKTKTPNRLYLPIIRAVQIPFGGSDMGMAHQCLHRFQVVTVIQEGHCKGMPHDMAMNPFLD